MHNPTSWPWNQHLYIACNDLFGDCTGNTFAYARTDAGLIWDNQYIVLCPRFYEQEDLQTIVDKADDGTYDKTQANTFIKAQGAMILHELMHIDKLVTKGQVEDNPQCLPPDDPSVPEGSGIYNAGPIAAAAKQYNAEKMVCVADAYRVTAASVFAQNRFKLPNPPGPPIGPGNGVGDPPETDKRLVNPQGFDSKSRPKGLPNPDDPHNTPGDDSMDFESGDAVQAGSLFGIGQVVEPGKDVEGEDALKVIPSGSPIS